MYSIWEEIMLKEAAAEQLLEEAAILKFAAEQLPWSVRHPYLSRMLLAGGLSALVTLPMLPLAVRHEPAAALGLAISPLLAGLIYGLPHGLLAKREHKILLGG